MSVKPSHGHQTRKGHNVQFVSVPEGVEKVKSKLSKEFSYTFEQEGVYLYVLHTTR